MYYKVRMCCNEYTVPQEVVRSALWQLTSSAVAAGGRAEGVGQTGGGETTPNSLPSLSDRNMSPSTANIKTRMRTRTPHSASEVSVVVLCLCGGFMAF